MSEEAKASLAIISGFSGVGKGTVVEKLIHRYPYALSVSATTRSPRPGEIPDVSYHYITKEAFEKQIAEGGFLEYAQYVDNYYGTPKPFVLENLKKGRSVILEIESEGAFKVKKQYPDALMIYMLPPSFEELRKRLMGRGTETEEKIQKRLRQAAQVELPRVDRYDFVIVNDDLEACVEEVHQVIETHEGTRPGESETLKALRKEMEDFS